MTPEEYAAQAAANAAAMPTVSAIVAQARAAFGADVRVIYARENGIERGTPTPPGVKLTDAMVSKLIEQRSSRATEYQRRRHR